MSVLRGQWNALIVVSRFSVKPSMERRRYRELWLIERKVCRMVEEINNELTLKLEESAVKLQDSETKRKSAEKKLKELSMAREGELMPTPSKRRRQTDDQMPLILRKARTFKSFPSEIITLPDDITTIERIKGVANEQGFVEYLTYKIGRSKSSNIVVFALLDSCSRPTHLWTARDKLFAMSLLKHDNGLMTTNLNESWNNFRKYAYAHTGIRLYTTQTMVHVDDNLLGAIKPTFSGLRFGEALRHIREVVRKL